MLNDIYINYFEKNRNISLDFLKLNVGVCYQKDDVSYELRKEKKTPLFKTVSQ